jgi:hypothetical protein
MTESELHELTPKACETFTRLLLALRKATFEKARKRISELIRDPLREVYKNELGTLAEASLEFGEISEIQVPPGGNWMLRRPLTQDSREETMKFVLQTGHALTDAGDELLADLGKLGDPEIPEFVLGELPREPEPTEPVPELLPNSMSSTEQEFMNRVCQDVGKDFDKLTDQEKLVLQATLDNFRTGRLLGCHRCKG